jgi:hypothetical protein
VRRILTVLSLLVVFSTVAAAQPAKSGGKAGVSRPAASPVHPSVLEKLWKQLMGSIRMFDEEDPPPPPPERVHTPVPT